jgi:hypothetical protein
MQVVPQIAQKHRQEHAHLVKSCTDRCSSADASDSAFTSPHNHRDSIYFALLCSFRQHGVCKTTSRPMSKCPYKSKQRLVSELRQRPRSPSLFWTCVNQLCAEIHLAAVAREICGGSAHIHADCLRLSVSGTCGLLLPHSKNWVLGTTAVCLDSVQQQAIYSDFRTSSWGPSRVTFSFRLPTSFCTSLLG